MFWHIGSALGGVKLLIRSSDADKAAAILSHCDETTSEQQGEDGYTPDEDLAEQEAEDEDPRLSLPATRALRAAIIGVLFFPPLLNLYSMWVLIRHGLLGTRPIHWRAIVAFVVNLFVFSCIAVFVYVVVMPQNSHVPPHFPGTHPFQMHKTITIPLVPG